MENNKYIGVESLTEKNKSALLLIYYDYCLISETLNECYGFVFCEKYILQILEMILDVTDKQKLAIVLSTWVREKKWEEINRWLSVNENSKMLTGLAKDIVELRRRINQAQTRNWWVEYYVKVRYGDWNKRMTTLAVIVLLIVFYGLSLYLLMNTDFGRSIAWMMTDTVGMMMKFVFWAMIFLAIVFIFVGGVIYYLENKRSK